MSTANNVMTPIKIYKEFVVLGCSNTSGNSFIISPSADLNDSLGSTSARWSNVFTYGLSLGNTTINSNGNSTVNSASSNGYTILPGGVILQWGTGVANTTGNTVTFKVPYSINCFSFGVTGTQANITSATSNSTTGTVVASAGTPAYTWQAIGQ